MCGYQFVATGERANLAGFADTDLLDDAIRRELPPNAVVLAYGPETCFRFWGGEAEEGVRPDITLVPMPFLTYPGLVEELARTSPELRDLLRDERLRGKLGLPQLQSLAATRPTLVELDLRYPEAFYETLVPDGLYHRVLADGATRDDRREGARLQQQRFQRMHLRLREIGDSHTRNQLLMRHYNNALFHAALGDRDEAIAASDYGRKINPRERVLHALRAVLDERDEDGERLSRPLDITPYRVDRPVIVR